MLQLYASTYGVRAVLWMQGETDIKSIEQSDNPNSQYRNDWTERLLTNVAGRLIAAAEVPLGNGNLENAGLPTIRSTGRNWRI